MKKISQELLAHLRSNVTTTSVCWKLTLSDDTVMGFTDYDKDLVIDGVTYVHAAGSTTSSVVDNSSMAVDNLSIEGVLSSDYINEQDLLAGKYDYSEIHVFIVNYNDLSQGIMTLRYGRLGRVTVENGQFSVEVRGLKDNLLQTVGNLYSPTCRANFCDSKCSLSISSYTDTGTIEEVENSISFKDTSLGRADDYYTYGNLSFTSGKNKGLSFKIKDYKDDIITLVLPTTFAMSVGDIYSITAGCDKTLSTCKNRFNNILNFRGEPHVPGIDKMFKTAGTY